MGLKMTGEVLGVYTKTVKPQPGDTWSEFTNTDVRIFDGNVIVYARVANSYDGDVPKKGDKVEADVTVTPYLTKEGSARLQFTVFSCSYVSSGDSVKAS